MEDAEVKEQDIEQKARLWTEHLEGREREVAEMYYYQGMIHFMDDIQIPNKKILFWAHNYGTNEAAKVESLTQIELADALTVAFAKGMQEAVEMIRNWEGEIE